jgi:transposase
MSQRTVGIDLGITAPSVAVVLDEKGQLLIERHRFELSVEQLEQLEGKALAGAPEGSRLHVVMEKTFPTCEYVSRFFAARNHEVSYAKPDQLKAFRTCLSPKVKTDTRDAWLAARLPYLDPRQLQRVHSPSTPVRILRTLVSQRAAMVRQLVFLKNQLIRYATAVWPGLTSVLEDLDSNYARAFLREFDPATAAQMEAAAVAEFLRQHGRLRLTSAERLAGRLVVLAQRVAALHGLMQESGGLAQHRSYTLELIEHIEQLERRIDSKEKEIEQAYRLADPEQHLQSIPGVGAATAPIILSFFSDPNRFSTSRHAQGFVGFYPETDASGRSDRKATALSKKGPGELRHALFLVADHFRRHDPQGARLYHDQMTHKGKHHTSALCVVANRFVIPRILAVLKEKRLYELRDFEGQVIDKEQARQLCEQFRVSDEVRGRLRSLIGRGEEKSRSSASPQVTSELEAPRNGTAPRQEDPINQRLSVTKAQLGQLVFRMVDRLLTSGANLEEIRLQLLMEERQFFQNST